MCGRASVVRAMMASSASFATTELNEWALTTRACAAHPAQIWTSFTDTKKATWPSSTAMLTTKVRIFRASTAPKSRPAAMVCLPLAGHLKARDSSSLLLHKFTRQTLAMTGACKMLQTVCRAPALKIKSTRWRTRPGSATTATAHPPLSKLGAKKVRGCSWKGTGASTCKTRCCRTLAGPPIIPSLCDPAPPLMYTTASLAEAQSRQASKVATNTGRVARPTLAANTFP